MLGRGRQVCRLLMLKAFGYRNISMNSTIESGILLDKVNRGGIYIGGGSLIAAKAVILSHEHVKRDPVDHRLPFNVDTVIGERVFVGVGATILPGAHIESDCVIGAGAVVRGHVPAGSMVVGNPGKVVKTNLQMDSKARLI